MVQQGLCVGVLRQAQRGNYYGDVMQFSLLLLLLINGSIKALP